LELAIAKEQQTG